MAGKHRWSKAAFDRRVKKWKAKKKEGEKKAKEEKHFSSRLKRLGMLSKGNSYAKNGYFQVQSMPDRKKPYLRAQAGKLNYADSNDNFFTLKRPYPIQAHHILPKEAFSGELNDKERNLLLRVPYDINHGENIIFLPEDESNCAIHRLPAHRGSHPSYNNGVKIDLRQLKSRLKTKEKPPCDKAEGPQMAILADLKSFQDLWWDWLANNYKEYGEGTTEEWAATTDFEDSEF